MARLDWNIVGRANHLARSLDVRHLGQRSSKGIASQPLGCRTLGACCVRASVCSTADACISVLTPLCMSSTSALFYDHTELEDHARESPLNEYQKLGVGALCG